MDQVDKTLEKQAPEEAMHEETMEPELLTLGEVSKDTHGSSGCIPDGGGGGQFQC